MAVHFPTSSQELDRASGTFLAPGSGSIGFAYWLRINSTWVGTRQYSYIADGGGTHYALVTAPSSTSDLQLTVNGATLVNTSTTPIVLTVGTWYYITVLYQKSNTTWTLYVNGVSKATFSDDMTGITFTGELLGGNAFGSKGDFDIAYYRSWQSTGTLPVITATNVLSEMQSPQAVQSLRLFADTPLTAASLPSVVSVGTYADYATGTRYWRVLTATTTVSGPSIDPWQLQQIVLVVRQEADI